MITTVNELLKKYPAQAPRYTGYPTAPHFSPLPRELHRQWLQAVAAEEAISLYLHVPYCSKLCWFCGCHTKITHKYGPVATYLDGLCREAALVRNIIGRKQPVEHIHFGGGSPTILHADDFSMMMQQIRSEFTVGEKAEIAIEIDPRTVNEAKIAAYVRNGVNRVSIGVQDFDPAVQKAINRVQPFNCVYDAVKLCRAYGIEHINFDLIYGLPKQTISGFETTLEYALSLNPSRLALFGYAHVPWMKKHMRLIDEAALPDAAMRHRLFQIASDYLQQSGYVAIGLDHFVKPGDAMALAYNTKKLRRNFQGYTVDTSNTLIGLGASAISSFAQGYVQNTAAIEDYQFDIVFGVFATQRGHALTEDDMLRRDIIEQLMCYNTVDINACCARHGQTPDVFTHEMGKLRSMASDGMVEINHHFITVNPKFPQSVRLVCAVFDHYFASKENRHAQVA